MSSAYVLEVYGFLGNNNGDLAGYCIVATDLASLRAGFEGLTAVADEFASAIWQVMDSGDEDSIAVRVWTVEAGVATAALDARPFVRFIEGDRSATLHELSVFEDDPPEPSSEDARVEVMWDAVESRLKPLTGPLLQDGEELEVDAGELDDEPWFVGSLKLGENFIEV